jgi:glycosyltransferase involved in cell wall biosynthesis
MAKILIIGSWPRSLVNFRGKLIDELLVRGHEIYPCAGGTDSSVIEWLCTRGIRYHSLPLERTGLNPFKDIILLIKLIQLINRIKPDIVIGYTIKPIVYGLIAARICKVTYLYALITGLGSTFLETSSKRQKLVKLLVPYMYKLALKNCTNIFFQNKDDKDEFIAKKIISKDMNYSITNGSGVDVHHFQSAPQPQGDLVFLFIARLLKDKGIVEYVEAARNLKKEYVNVKFKILGPIDKNPSAISQKEITTLVEENIVEYLGEVDDVRPYIRSASVIVLPSYREGMPRAVLEGMAMARAIITTDVPGCRETVINGENGFLVQVKNVEELANAMKKFILSSDLAYTMGLVSRKIAENKFDVNLVNNHILKVMKL